MISTKKKIYDQSDIMMANMIGVPVDKYLETLSELDEDQVNSIMTRLLSDHDREIKEGIEMFLDVHF